jgi:AcrR family transcriptional regulator
MARRKGVSITKADVVAAAIACLDAEGEDGLALGKVAARLGVQPPALYFHFASSRDLRKAVAIEGWRQMFTFFVEPREEAIELEPVLRRVAHAYRHFAMSHPAFYAVMSSVRIEYGDSESMPLLAAFLNLFGSILRPLGFTDAETVHAIRILRSTCHGFVELERLGQFEHPEPLDGSFEWAVDFLIYSFKSFKESHAQPSVSSGDRTL